MNPLRSSPQRRIGPGVTWWAPRTFALLLGCVCFVHTWANNIQVTNTHLSNPAATTVGIEFDLSWENSWRTNSAPANWDAVWVFAKVHHSAANYWYPVYFTSTGHTATSGATVTPGLEQVDAPYDATFNRAAGAFVHRGSTGSGNFSSHVTLRWNWTEWLPSLSSIDSVKVFAIEMVYVPGGAYTVGSNGVEVGSLTNPFHVFGPAIPQQISTEGAFPLGPWPAGQLWGTDDASMGPQGQLPAAYPKGFRGFYCMKYELSQKQIVDFLNTLDHDAQFAVSPTSLEPGVVEFGCPLSMTFNPYHRHGIRIPLLVPDWEIPVRFLNDLGSDGNANGSDDGQWVACNYMNLDLFQWYLIWSGLRPMSELEYEKACRGPLTPVANEYAWGSTFIQAATMAFDNMGEIDESSSLTTANVNGGEAWFSGPTRVGIFAKPGTGRQAAGASYYGIMDLTGNLAEIVVNLGTLSGRAFDGNHVSSLGWPQSEEGFGLRGGTWAQVDAHHYMTSDRSYAIGLGLPLEQIGGRGVRTAP